MASEEETYTILEYNSATIENTFRLLIRDQWQLSENTLITLAGKFSTLLL